MPLTKTQIISNAVTLIGNKPIISTSGQGSLVNAAEQAYDFLLPAKLSESFWRFATKTAQLSQLVETPPTEIGWQYIYQLPSDYSKMVRLFPQNYNFEIYEGNRLYSSLDGPLYIEYVRAFDDTDAAQLPMYFVHYFVYELALYLCLASADSVAFYNALKPERDYLLSLAQANDAQNRPGTGLVSEPVISNRFVTTWALG